MLGQWPERFSRFYEADRGDVEEEAEARGDVGKRPIDRQVRIGQCRCGHVGGTPQILDERGDDCRERAAKLLEVALIQIAGPLVHEYLLELARQCTARSRVTPVDPATELASTKPNVLILLSDDQGYGPQLDSAEIPLP